MDDLSSDPYTFHKNSDISDFTSQTGDSAVLGRSSNVCEGEAWLRAAGAEFASGPLEFNPDPSIAGAELALACAFLDDAGREQWRAALADRLGQAPKSATDLLSRIEGASERFYELTALLPPSEPERKVKAFRTVKGVRFDLLRWDEALAGDWSKFQGAIFNKHVRGVEAISRQKQNAKHKRYRENNADKVAVYQSTRADAQRENVREWKKINLAKVALQKKNARGVLYNGRPFVTIDSEGAEKKGDDKFHNGQRFSEHVSFLWGAGFERDQTQWLESQVGEQLSTQTILDWLLSLPGVFGKANFIAFAFSYDVGQILRGLPRKKAWEIARNRTFPEKGKLSRPVKAATLWRGYALRYRKGKKFEVWRLRDPQNPYTINAKGQKVLDTTDFIAIHDVFSFYQTGLVKVVESLQKQGHVTSADFRLLKRNKAKRNSFDIDRIFPSYARSEYRLATLKRYCALELELTALALRQLRSGFESIELRLKEWTGPGSAAAALLKKEGVFEQYPKDIATLDIPLWQDAAFHSFFGANIQLCKQGFAPNTPLFGYDVVSAYPSEMEKLPSMKDGQWRHVECFDEDSRAVALTDYRVIASGNMLDMYLVQWEFPEFKRRRGGGEDYLPFYPLPYRRNDGAIIFPSKGYGWHTRDGIVGALEWMKRFEELGYFKRPEVVFTIEEAWLFHSNATIAKTYETKNFQLLKTPSSDADMERPFAFVRSYFGERRAIKQDIAKSGRYNIAELVIKLVINSLYGKTAQRIGGAVGEPPSCANPYYAAAITGGTRLKLLRAALIAPHAVVMFATDGIVSTEKLEGLPRAFAKDDPCLDLGDWECVENLKGGIFLQSGVYSFLSGKATNDKDGGDRTDWSDTTKLRGIDVRNLTVGMPMRQFLLEYVLPAWRKPCDMIDETTWPAVPVMQRRYATPGQAVTTAKSWDNTAGRWSDPIARMVRVHCIGVKRNFIPGREHLYHSRLAEDGTVIEADRCHSLVDTRPSWNATPKTLSAPSYPDWLEHAPTMEAKATGDFWKAALDAARPDIRANAEARRELTHADAVEDFPDLDEGGAGESTEALCKPKGKFSTDYIASLLGDYDEAANVAANW